MNIPELNELPQEVQESLEAGRIGSTHVKIIKQIINKRGYEAGLNALKYFEKQHFIQKYLESSGLSFKIHSFAYHSKLSALEKQKIAIALKEALSILECDLRMEDCI